ncbi:DNA alkylation repair protein [bacterium RCC_150]
MSDAADFVDYTLQREGTWSRAEESRRRLGNGLGFYGASVGAVRGTIRDALRRYPALSHDEVTALSSELWEPPVFERRFAAIVLLQSKVDMLLNTDLTRIEGFLRQAGLPELVDPLAVDVVGPVLSGLKGRARERAERVLDRWASDSEPMLRRAAETARAADAARKAGRA